MQENIPPQAIDAEKAVLGAILLESAAYDRIADLLVPESFYHTNHQRIFRAMQDLKSANQPVDLITLVERLRNTSELDDLGGAYSLVSLTNSVVSTANLEFHANIIAGKYMLRQLIRVSSELISQAMQFDAEPNFLLEQAEKAIMGINATTGAEMKTMETVIMELVEKVEYWRSLKSGITGVPSGFEKLDIATRGWQPGDLIIIAARPSVGKTAFALNLIMNAVQSGFPTAVWSLEMKSVYLALRMLSAESGVILHKIQTGRLTDSDLKQIQETYTRLMKSKIFFDDSSHINIRTLKAKARRLVKKNGVKLIVIDYLQLMQGETKGNREQEIATISRELKNLAQELEIPIIALSQLSREGVKTSSWDIHPPISSLRESGAIEQDADLILMLWGANDTEVANDACYENKRRLRILKQRNGMLITVDLDFQNEIQLFKKAAEIQTF